ncbi:FAD-binding protein [Mediterraneibacter massiliensis]|uniref:FAD-binding protein n=1 Tax=Mediterraneibacter massiliensis TaxID=1720300 RepID=UPI0022E0CA97|nr:FAD-binding protein [Mediterraneibacter massiliensis]
MKNDKYDVLVVGGGIAGCTAAISASMEGKSVAAVFPNGGASELSAGAIDILGVVPGEKAEIVDKYEEGIAKVVEAEPDHPYKYSKDNIEESVGMIIELAKASGYELQGFHGRNVWVPNTIGTFSTVAYVPSTMSSSVCSTEKNTVLVVGIAGNVNFNAEAAAQSYEKYQKQLGFRETYYSVVIELDGMKGRHKIGDSELADYLDTPEGVEDLSDKLTVFCANNRQKFEKILLPPVLGFINYTNAVKKLTDDLGCGVGEVMTYGNAVSGYRMTRAIYKSLEERGVKLLRGSRVDEISVLDGQAIAKCTVGITDQLHPGTKVELKAASLILATGGFLGGGIEARRRNTWLNLVEENVGQVTAEDLDRNPVNTRGQDALKIGVSVNENFTVKNNKFGGCIYACGDFLAGHNSASERSGTGVAASTGWLAGKNAAQRA